ncbi:MAG: periplasmic protein TonB [Alphaproteobacteria bacterium]|jgi:protein TonB|nr:periplasmic protein TonB [Alphaproteobacteria bacterium]
MTARAVALLNEPDDLGIGRWSLAAAIVLAVHLGLMATYLWLAREQSSVEPEAGAVLIDLAPLAADAPPEPEVTEPPPEPQVIEPAPQIEPLPSPIIVQPDRPKPPQPIKRAERKPAAAAAAPRNTAVPPGVRASWEGSVAAQLRRAQRYPSGARARNEQGAVTLSFSLNRNGGVLAEHIVRSSGYPELDQEVLAMVQRAQPFPPFPPEMTQARIDLTVPIRFTLH